MDDLVISKLWMAFYGNLKKRKQKNNNKIEVPRRYKSYSKKLKIQMYSGCMKL